MSSSMLTTSAMRGPRRQSRSSSSTAAVSPATSASTEPSIRLRTQPDMPRAVRLLHHPLAVADALHAAADDQALAGSCSAAPVASVPGTASASAMSAAIAARRRRQLRASSPQASAWNSSSRQPSACAVAASSPALGQGQPEHQAAECRHRHAQRGQRRDVERGHRTTQCGDAVAVLPDIGDAARDPQRRVVGQRGPVEPRLPFALPGGATSASRRSRRGSTAGRSRRSGRWRRWSARVRAQYAAAPCRQCRVSGVSANDISPPFSPPADCHSSAIARASGSAPTRSTAPPGRCIGCRPAGWCSPSRRMARSRLIPEPLHAALRGTPINGAAAAARSRRSAASARAGWRDGAGRWPASRWCRADGLAAGDRECRTASAPPPPPSSFCSPSAPAITPNGVACREAPGRPSLRRSP